MSLTPWKAGDEELGGEHYDEAVWSFLVLEYVQTCSAPTPFQLTTRQEGWLLHAEFGKNKLPV